ncbi:MAG: hypothetical protein IT450_16830 [Phycisphaerales bacterium]|nr:hypothetical protein [Phycisphaerales bacterium]
MATTVDSSFGRAGEMLAELTERRALGHRVPINIGRCTVRVPMLLGKPLMRSAAAVSQDVDDFVTTALIAAVLGSGGFAPEELQHFAGVADREAADEAERAERDRVEARMSLRVIAARRVCADASTRYELARMAVAEAETKLAAAKDRAANLRNSMNRQQSGGWLGRFGGGKARRADVADESALRDVESSIAVLTTGVEKARAEFDAAASETRKLFEISQPASKVEEADRYAQRHGIERPRYELSPEGLAQSGYSLEPVK